MACSAAFRFYAELNDFLPIKWRQRRFDHPIAPGGSIKDAIESIGVPHTEIDLILRDREPIGFAVAVRPGDVFSIFPAFHSIDISTFTLSRSEPLPEQKFVLDVHLGKLAAYLRSLGFDSDYAGGRTDEELAGLATHHRRILLTRDRGLLKRSCVTHGYCVRSTVPREQLIEVMRRFDLYESIRISHRCVRCNGLLARIEKSTVLSRLPARSARYYDDYWMCGTCGQLFWRGSHYQSMQRLLEHVRSHAP